jgi:hypothetical protein
MTKNSFTKNDCNKVFKDKFGRDLKEQEIEEIKQSLYYFAKAKIEYLRQKKGEHHAK